MADSYITDPDLLKQLDTPDDAFERVLRIMAGPGRQAVVPEPSFTTGFL